MTFRRIHQKLTESQDLLKRRQEAVKHIIATIFSAQDALRDLAPEQRWAAMGNLLGDYGEYIALANYNLKKAPRGADGYDAVTSGGLKVQVKANHSSSTIGFRGEADLLLVLKVERVIGHGLRTWSSAWARVISDPFQSARP